MSKTFEVLNTELLMTLGSEAYPNLVQYAEAVLFRVFVAPEKMQEELLRIALRHFGGKELVRTGEILSIRLMSELELNMILARAKKRIEEELSCMSKENLSLKDFAFQFLALLKKASDRREQAVILALAQRAGLLPYNFSEISCGLTEAEADRLISADEDIRKRITEVIESPVRYHSPADYAKRLLDLIDHGNPDQATRYMRMALALQGPEMKTTIVIGMPSKEVAPGHLRRVFGG